LADCIVHPQKQAGQYLCVGKQAMKNPVIETGENRAAAHNVRSRVQQY
jgi:hypothetical protein